MWRYKAMCPTPLTHGAGECQSVCTYCKGTRGHSLAPQRPSTPQPSHRWPRYRDSYQYCSKHGRRSSMWFQSCLCGYSRASTLSLYRGVVLPLVNSKPARGHLCHTALVYLQLLGSSCASRPLPRWSLVYDFFW